MEICFCRDSALEILHVLRVAGVPSGWPDPSARTKPVALRRLRQARVPSGRPAPDAMTKASAWLSQRIDDVQPRARASLAGFALPFHVLVSNATCRRGAQDLVFHQVSAPLPPGSLARLAPDLLTVSPELLFLQASAQLDFIELVWFACSLCAVYSVHPRLGGDLLPARPATNTVRLLDYLQKASALHLKHTSKAARAANLALDYAASPRELELALQATLPYARGGKALPKPRLNHRIALDARLAAIHRASHLCVDACWPEPKMVLEFDGDAHHMDAKRRARDNHKRATLEAMGYRVEVLSSKQLDSVAMTEDALKRTARYLGLRDRSREAAYDWQRRRSDLRAKLWRLGLGPHGDGAPQH